MAHKKSGSALIGGVLVLAAAGAGAAVLLMPKKAGALSSLILTVSPAAPSAGQDVAVTISALDASQKPVGGVQGSLSVNGTVESGVFGLTDPATGAAGSTITFPAAGTYTLQASASGVMSNKVTVAVSQGTTVTGYSLGTSPSAILIYGIPTLSQAVTDAQNYQLNSEPNPPTLYIYDDQGNLVDTITPTPLTGAVNLEIYDYDGISVFDQQYPSLSAAQAYEAANGASIVPGSGSMPAGGTYIIYDPTTSAELAYGTIA